MSVGLDRFWLGLVFPNLAFVAGLVRLIPNVPVDGELGSMRYVQQTEGPRNLIKP